MPNCIFCDIIVKKTPADIKLEEKDFIVIQDLFPKAKIHWLIIPKPHIPSLNELSIGNKDLIINMLLMFKKIAEQAGLTTGYRTIINTGRGGGQEIDHLHFHMLGGGSIPGL